jgi:hypothetical protein
MAPVPANKQTVLRFVLKAKAADMMQVMSRFHPQGKTLLNRTEWRGKEPRSCGVTAVHGRPYGGGSDEPVVIDVEVSYRPKGVITFVGDTKYDGWTAMLVKRAKDGTFLDREGNPLPDGEEPVLVPYEVYEDAEFNEIDFGEFVGEFDVEGINHVRFDVMMGQFMASGRVGGSLSDTFMAARKHRPLVKIILSNAPSGTGVDGFRTRLIMVNNSTPHLQQVLLDHLTELVSGFIEGRYSMVTLSGGDRLFVDLNQALVDCTPNEQGLDSRFEILHEYVPDTFLDELAQRLMATYEVDVSVVEGERLGLLLGRSLKKRFGES